MASVRVGLAEARQRRLPAVSVRSGRAADGYAPAGRPPYVVRVPLTQTEFDEVVALQHRRRSALWGGVGCLALGVAMARFPVLLPLAIAIAVVSAVLWGVTVVLLRRRLPRVEPGPGAGEVTLHGVHRDFVRALDRGGDQKRK